MMEYVLVIGAWLVCAFLSVVFWALWWRAELDVDAKELGAAIAVSLIAAPMMLIVSFVLWAGQAVAARLGRRFGFRNTVVLQKKGSIRG